MLTISHLQAQHLIRQSLDRPLPDEQWSALQAHLEGCPDCRNYRTRQIAMEKNLRRMLGHHWSAVGGPHKIPETVTQIRARRKQLAKMAKQGAKMGGVALAVFLVGWFILWITPSTSDRRASGSARTANATSTADVAAPLFRGTVLYSDAPSKTNPHHLFLLTGGPNGVDTVKLTGVGSPNGADLGYGDNIYPTWSPDGQWIAYLSSRGDPSGKTYDVYTMTVAGTHITRLTNDPAVTYSGPISWSGDGRWIAGLAKSVDGSRPGPWISLIPIPAAPTGISGTTIQAPIDLGARALARSTGASAFKFSPTGDRLAYLQGNQLKVFDIDQASTTVAAAPPQIIEPGFDWSPDGRALVFYLNGSPAEIRAVDAVPATTSPAENNQPTPTSSGPIGTLLVSQSVSQFIGSPTWYPSGGGILYLLWLDHDYCAEPRLIDVSKTGPRPANPGLLPRFCAMQDLGSWLDRGNWVTGSDGFWLVTPGDNPTDAAPTPAAQGTPAGRQTRPAYGIFALRYPPPGEETSPMKIEKLAEVHALSGQPRARPNATSLNLNPAGAPGEQPNPEPGTPASATEAAPTPSPISSQVEPPLAFPGQIAGISRDSAANGEIVRFTSGPSAAPADGSALPANVTRYPSPGGKIACAALSPEGLRVAFTGITRRGQAEIFILMLNDGRAFQVTVPAVRVHDPMDAWTYNCPVWSPEGNRLAVTAHSSANEDLLQILPVSGYNASLPVTGTQPAGNRAKVTPTPTARPSAGNTLNIAFAPRTLSTAPRWLPDGSAVLLGTSTTESGKAGILRVDAHTGEVAEWFLYGGFDMVGDLAESPEGGALAYLAVTYDEVSRQTVTLHADITGGDNYAYNLPPYDSRASAPGYGFLTWRQSDSQEPARALLPRLAYLFRGGPVDQVKARVDIFTAAEDGITSENLASLPDEILAAAWSQDGNMLVYSTELGTYILDIRQANPQPVKVSAFVFEYLDWK